MVKGDAKNEWFMIRAILIISGLIGIAPGAYFFFLPASAEPADTDSELGSQTPRDLIMLWALRICFIGGGIANCAIGIFSSDEAIKRRFTPRNART